ncbi:DUF1254 domain-containing protein [Caballeronia sp. GAFFF1]|uniref:DUF1254 domain-containing protein n=1 Tax=Caballeronia sp. GAFFF1 TaxID=2921779 RepID=UPI002027A010|nr:DUF1254 domain-containing protein [Caballeronia sp. GAFFF1]
MRSTVASGSRYRDPPRVDTRTDSFAQIGAMYGTRPGFYLLVGPDWNGTVPAGITRVFRSATGTAFVVPRVFMDDTAEDRAAIQEAIAGIDIYPLSEFDGTAKRHDWTRLPTLSSPTSESGTGGAETKWVIPDKFFDELPLVLKDTPPLPGEEARYAQINAVLAAAKENPGLKSAMIDEAMRADKDLSTRCFSSGTGVAQQEITGPPPGTMLHLALTTSRARLSPSQTSLSTRAPRPSTCIRISMRMVSDCRERTGTP